MIPGLYIHVPFCATKCHYCDFYSITEIDSADAWLRGLEREAALYRDDFSRFDSLYIGGGTPSVLTANQLESLFDAVRRHFSFETGTEITVEMNPDDTDAEKLDVLKSLGVNRLSFGIQSFDDKKLSFMGRRHNAAGAQRALELAGFAGFENIGIDLIYGLPGQKRKEWLKTLELAVSYKPQHLSCYQLTLEKETPMRTMVERGEIELPTERQQERFFIETAAFLEARGFTHYEISNYAATGDVKSRHNQKYWDHTPYLGLGPAAHSFDGTTRWWNLRSVAQYCSDLEMDKKPVEDREKLTPDQLALERLYLGFRTANGVDVNAIPQSSIPALERLRKGRLVTVEGGRITPTLKGYLVADSLPVLLS